MSRGPVRSRARAGVARRVVARVGLVIALALGTIGATTASAAEPRLVFVDAREAGGRERVLTLGAMQAACPERTVEVDDPYHERRMRYRALPLVCVLDLGFADSGGAAGQSGHGLCSTHAIEVVDLSQSSSVQDRWMGSRAGEGHGFHSGNSSRDGGHQGCRRERIASTRSVATDSLHRLKSLSHPIPFALDGHGFETGHDRFGKPLDPRRSSI